MNTEKQKWGSMAFCLLTYAVMCMAWSAWQLLMLPNLSVTGIFWLNLAVKGMIWTSPFLLVVVLKKEYGIVSPERMLFASFSVIPFLILLCTSVCFLYTVRVVNGLQGTFVLWNWRFLALAASAGVFEEIAFRGYFFNKMAKPLGIYPAALCNGVLFAVYHYPEFFIRLDPMGFLSLRFLMLFTVGVVFCLVFAKWKSLWPTVIVHTLWNLLSYLWALAG